MQNAKNASIEIFQDLVLTCSDEHRVELYEALGKHAKTPWRHAKEREKSLMKDPPYVPDVIVFEREYGDNIAASGLVFWAESYGYKVGNIVPLQGDDLGISGYNDVLNDFINQVVTPALKDLNFEMNITPKKQSITAWISQEAADALHRFSACANKSTGSSHPSDERRWFEFLFAAHKAEGVLDVYLLERWLIEVEEWTPEMANKLVREYEFGMALLKQYDDQL